MVKLTLTASHDPAHGGWESQVYIMLNDACVLTLPAGQLWDEAERTEEDVVIAAVEDFLMKVKQAATLEPDRT